MFYLLSRRSILPGMVVALALFFALPAAADACGLHDVSITKAGPAQVNPGTTLTYTLTVHESQPGVASAGHVVVTDHLPAGLDILSARLTPDNIWDAKQLKRFGHPGCSISGQTVTCRIPVIDNGRNQRIDTVRIIIEARVPQALACTTLTNQATVKSAENGRDERDINHDNNRSALVTTHVLGCPMATPTPTPTATPTPTPTPTITPTPTPTPTITPTPTPEIKKDIHVVKTDNRDVTRPGHSLTYVITIENTGDVDMQDVEVKDTVPEKLTVGRISDGGTRSGRTITWSNLVLNAGEKKNLTFTATVHTNTGNGHILRNDVRACSADHDVCDDGSDTTRVERVPQVIAARPVPVTAKTGAASTLLSVASLISGALGFTYLGRRNK